MRTYAEFCAPYGIAVAQALFTRTELQRDGYLNARNTLLGLLEADVLPICNENDVVAVAELHQIGDNDTLSALVANLVDADLLVLLTDIKGLYTADPRSNASATHVPVVESITREVEAMAGGAGSTSSVGGMATKIKAARMATAAGTDVIICQGTIPNVILAIAAGEHVGTRFASKVSRTKSLRDAWMASDLARGHRIIVDAGAADALLENGRSLLPAGIIAVEGTFDRGDTVEIRVDGGMPLLAALQTIHPTICARSWAGNPAKSPGCSPSSSVMKLSTATTWYFSRYQALLRPSPAVMDFSLRSRTGRLPKERSIAGFGRN